MSVDLEKLDLRRPDPNYKPDPKSRGDYIESSATPVEEEEEEAIETPEDEPELKEQPTEEPEEEGQPEEAKADEDEDEDEDEDDEPERRKSTSVPYSKFRKSRRQIKELTGKLEQLQAQLDAVKDTQTKAENKEFEQRQQRIEELYEQIEEQRALGNSKDAAKLQRELDGLRGDLSRAEARRLALETAVRSQQVGVFNTTLSQIEAVFPELVEDSDDFDKDLVQDLEETIKGYEKLGFSMVEALQKASRRILRYDPMARGKAAYLKGFAGVIPGEKKVEEAPAKKEPVKVEPKKTEIRKNVEAAKKQPPDPADDTSDIQSKLDMNKISPEDYMKLPASARAKLRGDTLV